MLRYIKNFFYKFFIKKTCKECVSHHNETCYSKQAALSKKKQLNRFNRHGDEIICMYYTSDTDPFKR